MCSAATKMDNKKRLASDSTVRLEVESRRMEERLSVLRKIMSAEKSRREEAGGIHWQKGQKGPLHRRQAVAPPPEASRSQRGGRGTSEKPLRIRILTNRSKGAKDSPKLPSCGQCDKSTASLNCLECVENYCTVCFAKFHHKGALSRHHVRPLVNKIKPPVNPKTGSREATSSKPTNIVPTAKESSSSVSTTADGQTTSTAVATDISTQRDEAVRGRTNVIKASHSSFHEGIGGKGAGGSGSLLKGTYDEAEAAASFQKALAEWRAGGGARKTHQTGEKRENTVTMRDSSCSTQSTQATQSASAVMTADRRSLRVEFSNKTGVSYFERLMVRRHRVGTVFGKAGKPVEEETARPNIGTKPYLETEISEFEEESTCKSALRSGPTQYNLFYSAEVEGEVCPAVDASETTSPADLRFERPPSSVLIKVMDFVEEESKPKKASMPGRADSDDKPPALIAANRKLPSTERSRRKKPHSAKRQAINSTVKTSDATPTQKPRIGEETNIHVAASVRSAWTDSASQTHPYEHTDASSLLSTFFLSGVQRTDQSPTSGPPETESKSEEGASSRGRFQFVSTVWLPDSSSVAPDPCWESLGHTMPLQPVAPLGIPDYYCSNKEQDSDFDINTDLPPLTNTSPAVNGSMVPTRQTTASACTYYCDSDSSSSECSDDLSLYDIEEAEFEELQRLQEWEELADSEALESLTLELGRISRCQGEVEERVGESRSDCNFGGLVRDHREVAGGELEEQQERADSEALESLTLELGRITRCQGEFEERVHVEGSDQD